MIIETFYHLLGTFSQKYKCKLTKAFLLTSENMGSFGNPYVNGKRKNWLDIAFFILPASRGHSGM